MTDVTKKSKKAGLPPGSLIHVGKKHAEKVKISVIDYTPEYIEEKVCEKIEDCLEYADKPSISWLNIDGVHDVSVIEKVGAAFSLHPLLLEDILNTQHRPKVEDYDDYIFFTLKMLGFDKHREIISEQVSIILGINYVISFQEREGDIFDGLRERIRLANSQVRQRRPDYLVYRLIDTVVDHYFLIVEQIGEMVDKLEDEVMDDPDEDTMKRIQKLKRDLIFLRRSISPLREAVGSLDRGASKLIEEKTTAYLNDIHDHAIQLVETLETYRDMLSGLMDIYFTTISNRMNSVMKVLTVIATIFIPLTFVAGVYGMNFKFMPELNWKWAYPFVWLVMLAIASGMVYYFRKRKWF